jgi:uncharacterized protein with FMN-binding domain
MGMKALKKGFLATSLVMSLGGGLSAPLSGGAPGALVAQPLGAAGSDAVKAASSRNSGQYVGTREYAFYGYVKVQATVQNGKLTDITILEFPNHAGRSQYISSVALPYLVQEAVSAQSARVDLISGATLTSEAFAKSLDAALKKAGASTGSASISGA